MLPTMLVPRVASNELVVDNTFHYWSAGPAANVYNIAADMLHTISVVVKCD